MPTVSDHTYFHSSGLKWENHTWVWVSLNIKGVKDDIQCIAFNCNVYIKMYLLQL